MRLRKHNLCHDVNELWASITDLLPAKPQSSEQSDLFSAVVVIPTQETHTSFLWRKYDPEEHKWSSSTTYGGEHDVKGEKLFWASYGMKICEALSTAVLKQVGGGIFPKESTPFITFVLGGPGSGKGTQCSRIVETYGFTHLSAGDLLRKEIALNTEHGAMILDTITKGKIVHSEVTIKLIQRAIESAENDKFLIDGFPRSEENRIAYERIIGAEPTIVLFFDCPEEVMVKRVLSRNEGRIDDNIDTVKERLKAFRSLNLPVINYYADKGLLYKIDGTGTQAEIFERVRAVFDACK